MPRACDACSVRKIKCNSKYPCDSCIIANIPCSQARKRKKPGPKGPRKQIRDAIQHMQTSISELSTPQPCSARLPVETTVSMPSSTWTDCAIYPNTDNPIIGSDGSRLIPLSRFNYYLAIFHSQLRVIWPVVDCDSLKTRLQNANDRVGYALAAAICAATITQLHLSTDGSAHSPQSIAFEVDSARLELEYSTHEMIDGLLTCFFMHVFYSNTGKITKSTLLLRESIAYAHILGLHQNAFYTNLDPDTTQYHLRIAWILFITDKAHSLQHDIPSTFELAPTLPELQPQEDIGLSPGFCSLCKLFQSFHNACPPDLPSEAGDYLLGNISSQLSRRQEFPLCQSEVQRADLVVTDSWLRVVLWKAAIPYVDSTTDPNDGGLSVFFPTIVARDLLSKLTTLSSVALEAHGPGMVSYALGLCFVSCYKLMSRNWADVEIV